MSEIDKTSSKKVLQIWTMIVISAIIGMSIFIGVIGTAYADEKIDYRSFLVFEIALSAIIYLECHAWKKITNEISKKKMMGTWK